MHWLGAATSTLLKDDSPSTLDHRDSMVETARQWGVQNLMFGSYANGSGFQTLKTDVLTNTDAVPLCLETSDHCATLSQCNT